MSAEVEVGVIGGSGFYRFLDDVSEVLVHTPYGPPSAPVAVGEVSGRRVAFLPRHGSRHEIPPHRINYRANMWALHHLGVRKVIAPSSAGSLQSGIDPGDIVVCDQLVNRTWGRADTYFDGPEPAHVSFADPYCAALRRALMEAGGRAGVRAHPAGTAVVIQGPRFSTRAESAWYRGAGWSLVTMTQYPEPALARELGLCYACPALVTDYDTGDLPVQDGYLVSASAPVTMEAVFEVLRETVGRLHQVLFEAIPALSDELECSCTGGTASGSAVTGREASPGRG